MRLFFLHNLERAPNCGTKFNQHVEVSGFYFVPTRDLNPNPPKNWISGIIEIKNPLIIKLGKYESYSNWKTSLNLKYKAKKKRLAKKLNSLGYDAILIKTYDNESIESVYIGHI